MPTSRSPCKACHQRNLVELRGSHCDMDQKRNETSLGLPGNKLLLVVTLFHRKSSLILRKNAFLYQKPAFKVVMMRNKSSLVFWQFCRLLLMKKKYFYIDIRLKPISYKFVSIFSKPGAKNCSRIRKKPNIYISAFKFKQMLTV